jgi:hypothetical protein
VSGAARKFLFKKFEKEQKQVGCSLKSFLYATKFACGRFLSRLVESFFFCHPSIHFSSRGWLPATEMKTPFPHYCRGLLAVEIRFLKSSPWNKAGGEREARARACGQRAQKNKEAASAAKYFVLQ